MGVNEFEAIPGLSILLDNQNELGAFVAFIVSDQVLLIGIFHHDSCV